MNLRNVSKNRRGSAILSVTLLGLLILAISAALISITTTFNQQSYASNKQIVCRYAAEGVLQRIKYQIQLEDAGDAPGGWFDTARAAADPVETVNMPLTTGPTADSSSVSILIYDAAEASAQLGLTLGTDEYIVEARANSAGHTATLQMKIKYNLTTTTTTTSTPNPLGAFSKYVFWTNTSATLTPGDVNGFCHTNGNRTIGAAADRFALPITCTGTLTYQAAALWQHFDWDRNGVLDTIPRPEFANYSEADAYNESGGGKPSVDKPSYAGVNTTLRDGAISQTMLNPTLAGLYVDASNPLYSTIGTLQTSAVNFAHNAGTGLTTATITVTGSLGTRTQSVIIPPGQPLVLYSTPRVSSLGGSLYGQVTIASPFKGTATSADIGGSLQTVISPPSISVTDHLMLVDQAGRPKYWLYDTAGNPKAQPTRLSYTGMPQSSTANIDNDTAGWSSTSYAYRRNLSYSAATVPVLGLIGTGDITFKPASTQRNIIVHGAQYAGDPDTRVSADPALIDSNHTNICFAGSRVSSLLGALGDFEYSFRTYDTDMLTVAPPYWVAPAGMTTTTATTTTISAVIGNVFDRTRRK